jgi:T5orf172 domain
MKPCPRCLEIRPPEDFYECGHKWCRPCVRLNARKWKEQKRMQGLADLASKMEDFAFDPDQDPNSPDSSHIELCKEEGRSEPLPKRQKVDDTLYLIHNPRIPGEVKVGRARDVEARLKDLSSCQNFSLELLQAWPGLGCLEREVHHQLDARRLRGYPGREWFRLDPTEVELVDEVVQGLELLRGARERLLEYAGPI